MINRLSLVLSCLWLSCASPNPVQNTRKVVRSGKKIYEQYCLPCHQTNGNGLEGINPPLKGSEYVLGNKARIVNIVLKGSNEGLLVNGKRYSNAMPPHGFLSDQEIANVLSYIRNSFGNRADSLSEQEVRMVRKYN
ncbi:Cytochrome C oxidase, cbb3-type, subunit III [bacterium A37T11]|nr:Cytochrome C oxidase, cbb3-type, subunit III [bacterium A37T11]